MAGSLRQRVTAYPWPWWAQRLLAGANGFRYRAYESQLKSCEFCPISLTEIDNETGNLRGACDAMITGETAEAMGAASKQHVMQMLQAGDAAHKQAMDAMMKLSQADQEKWYGEFVAGFAALPDA